MGEFSPLRLLDFVKRILSHYLEFTFEVVVCVTDTQTPTSTFGVSSPFGWWILHNLGSCTKIWTCRFRFYLYLNAKLNGKSSIICNSHNLMKLGKILSHNFNGFYSAYINGRFTLTFGEFARKTKRDVNKNAKWWIHRFASGIRSVCQCPSNMTNTAMQTGYCTD